jgi:aryl-alcohol dehydrogenase-like predicted oxidoreductase
MADALEVPRFVAAIEASRRLARLADEWGFSSAALAITFALRNPSVASVLLGVTRPSQLDENVAAINLAAKLDDAQLAELATIGGNPDR